MTETNRHPFSAVPHTSPCSNLELTERERAALRKSAEADMKKHGFKTVDELTAYYDRKRGY